MNLENNFIISRKARLNEFIWGRSRGIKPSMRIKYMEEKKKILVVDDDSGIGEMLKTLLEFYGYEVTVTENPDKTEALIIENKINLVMLDMLISGVNGTDVCARIRQDERTANTPVLMMSALHDAGNKCKNAGADDFIAKPFEMSELTSKINKVLSNRQNLSS
jgi:DNA-binding response OmpR family regulator